MIASRTKDTYLIISDIHADIKALNTIIEIISDPVFVKRYGRVNTIINLGDTVGRGSHPVEVIERLAKLGILGQRPKCKISGSLQLLIS